MLVRAVTFMNFSQHFFTHCRTTQQYSTGRGPGRRGSAGKYSHAQRDVAEDAVATAICVTYADEA
jgi:hypothetical protein